MRITILLFITFTWLVNISCKDTNTFSVIDFGYIDTAWTYKNAGLGIDFPFEKGWYFMNSISQPSSYVKVGVGHIYIRGYNKPMEVPIEEFDKAQHNSIAYLFGVAKLDTTSDIVERPLDYHADKTFQLGVTRATDTSTYKFLRATCEKCTDEVFKEIFLKKVKIGNSEFDGYITGVADQSGNKLGHFFGIRRVKDMYIVLQYNFPDLQKFEEYKSYLARLHFNNIK